MSLQPRPLARHLSRLSRPQNVVYSGLLAAVAALLVGAGFPKSLACYGFFLCVYALAAGYNNVKDYRADVINKRADNPLTTEQIAPFILKAFFLANLVLLGLLQFVLTQPASILLTVAYLVLTVAYSHKKPRLQARGFWATLTLGVCYGSLPVLMGLAQGTDVLAVKPLAFGAFQIPLLFPLLLAKDYKDLRGDRAVGKRTPLVRHGPAVVLRVALGSAVLAAGLYIGMGFWLELNPLLTLVASEVYVFFAYWLHRTKGTMSVYGRKLATFLLLGMSLYMLVQL